ncbi:MAG: DUF2093 domain-containing protein [Rhodoblastus sp.]|nr:MAG: DUF2093 domain-containing protein [Rhodoblastus sp.]
MLRRDGGAGGEAKLDFRESDYRILKPGAYVVCAVSGKKIPLETLSYWSAKRQEAYAGPAEVARRLDGERAAEK